VGLDSARLKAVRHAGLGRIREQWHESAPLFLKNLVQENNLFFQGTKLVRRIQIERVKNIWQWPSIGGRLGLIGDGSPVD
jgi:hypothetical protein